MWCKMIRLIKLVLSTLLCLYVIYSTFFTMEPMKARSIFILLVLLIAILTIEKDKLQTLWGKVFIVVMAVCSILSFGYVTLFSNDILTRAGVPNSPDIVFGFIAVLLLLYLVQRSTGWTFTLIIIASVIYAFFGNLIPMDYGGHGGFTLNRFLTTVYLSTNGIFGSVMYVMFQYVFLFVLFGKILEYSGALSFVMTLSQALVGRLCGGPALVASISSMLVGSVSGSAVANVMITGSVSIPLMKKMKFEPEMAAGIEASASTGGQIMPPVMGAVAFVMAQFIGVGYFDVVRAALIPAILYFLSIIIGVYLYARRSGIQTLKKEEVPTFSDVIREPGLVTFTVGLGVLIYLLVIRYSAPLAAIISMALMLLLGALRKETRINISKLLNIFQETATNFVGVGLPAFGVGIIVGVLLMTGLSLRFGKLVVALAGGHFIPLLLMVAVMVLILGMGLPTAIAYILASLVAASALTSFGISSMQVHMFLLYLSVLSMITPPVALACYAASSLAGANFWKTGFASVRLCAPAFIIPFIFIYHEPLLMIGQAQEIVFSFITALIGVALIAYSLIGKVSNKAEIIIRILAFIAGLIMISPNTIHNIIIIAILVALGCYHLLGSMQKNKNRDLKGNPT
jgi:TRAP transporter 4TM/12TM fusion protein